MEKLKTIAAIFLILIGLTHIAFSFMSYNEITEEALWFVSGGLLFIISGCFNLFIQSNESQKLQRIIYLKTSNFLFALFLIFLVIQLPMLPGFIGLGCSIFLLIINQ